MILPSLLIFSHRMAQAQERAPGHHDRPFSENRATTLRSGKTPRGGLIWARIGHDQALRASLTAWSSPPHHPIAPTGSLLTAPGCRVNRKYPLRASVFAARELGIKRSDGLVSHEAPVMMNPAQSLVSRSGTLKEATRS